MLLNMKHVKFECGCQFEIIGKKPNGEPRLKLDLENIPLDCKATWELFHSGATKGVWQLESGTGKKWSSELKPDNIEELGVLNALIRPGSLRSLSGDPPKSMTQRYVDRKFKRESVTYLHEALRPILENTLGVLAYQEQTMKIAKDIAGFDLQQADVLRKCVTGDTIFYTQNGPRRLKLIHDKFDNKSCKFKFLTLDKKNKLCYKSINKVWSNGIKEVIKVKTNNGYNIKVTKNHRILTHNGWKNAENLTDKDFILTPKKYICPDKINKTNILLNSDYEKQHNSFLIPKDIIEPIINASNINSIIGITNISGSVYNKNWTYDRANRLNKFIGSDYLQEIIDADYRFCKIKSVEPCGEEEVFDFELEGEPHAAFANGIFIHNSIGKKRADIMAQVEKEFIDGCKKTKIVNEEQALEIFSWIRESQKYAFNKCLSPETIISTNKGLKTLDEAVVGDVINTPEGSSTIINKYDNGEKELFEIELMNGKIIRCTIDHKFMCEDGKIRPLWIIVEKNLAIVCECE